MLPSVWLPSRVHPCESPHRLERFAFSRILPVCFHPVGSGLAEKSRGGGDEPFRFPAGSRRYEETPITVPSTLLILLFMACFQGAQSPDLSPGQGLLDISPFSFPFLSAPGERSLFSCSAWRDPPPSASSPAFSSLSGDSARWHLEGFLQAPRFFHVPYFPFFSENLSLFRPPHVETADTFTVHSSVRDRG